jgi:alkaline phosphatase D
MITLRSLFIISLAFTIHFTVYGLSDRKLNLRNEKKAVIAFGACNNYKISKNPKIFNSVVETDPDLWIWTGDVAYLSTHETNGTLNELQFNQSKNTETYTNLRNKVPIIGIWDDHDYGVNNGDKSYKFKERNRQLYLDYLDEPKDSIRRIRPDGMYESYYLGDNKKIKIILLDNRYNRDFRFSLSPTRDILGESQWKWFEEELTNNEAEVTLVISGTQVMVDDRLYPEHWYKHSQDKLLQVIRKTQASGIILLSGDVHYAEIMKHPCPKRVGYNLYEVTSSGLTHYMSGYNLPYGGELLNAISPTTFNSEKDRYMYKNFGLITVDFEDKKNIKIEIKDEDGNTALNKDVSFEEIKYNKDMVNINSRCVLDESPYVRFIFSYSRGMMNWDKILWGFTILGGIGGIVGLTILLEIYKRVIKWWKKRQNDKKKAKKE